MSGRVAIVGVEIGGQTGMWAHYKKTLIPAQLFTLTVCAALYWYSHPPLFTIVFLFATMQIASIMGAWWAVRLVARKQRNNQTLPLERRL